MHSFGITYRCSHVDDVLLANYALTQSRSSKWQNNLLTRSLGGSGNANEVHLDFVGEME